MSSQNLHWAATEYAWIFAAVLALIVLVIAHVQWKSRIMRRLGDIPLIRRMTADVSHSMQWTRWGLVIVAITLLSTAVLRPQYGMREAELQNRGIDVVIALDMSKSMLVRDVAPNRLQAAIVELNEVLDRLSGGRVALVPFAGTAFTQTPLTTDLDAVRAYLDALRVEDMPVGGTRVGQAIRHVIRIFEQVDEEKDAEEDEENDPLDQPAASHFRAIILVSDGEDHDEDALEAARLAKAQNIRIYTVGLGRQNSSAPIPVVSAEGSQVGWVTSEENTPLFSDLNVALLRDIADESGGAAYIYGEDDVAQALSTALDALEKHEYEHHYESLREDRFQFLLIPAFLFLILEAVLPDRRRRRRRQLK